MTTRKLRKKVKHILTSTIMLCCGRRKETREGEAARRHATRPRVPPVVVQSDFRKVSGITSEVFRQLEAVEQAAPTEPPPPPGDLVVRPLEPGSLGLAGARRFLGPPYQSRDSLIHFVEILKRPGQTLGLYIREGDGLRTTTGVYISRIALESAVYNSRLLRVGDEILAVNLVDVRNMSLDDVVIIMSIPRRLVLAVKSRLATGPRLLSLPRRVPHEARPPVVVVKKEFVEDYPEENEENGALLHARTKGLPAEIPRVAVPLDVPRTTAVTKQPPRLPRTLESLAEQVQTITAGRQPAPLYPKSERTSTARQRYWGEHGASLRRSARLLQRSETYRGPPPRRYDGSILRRRGLESASDTEAEPHGGSKSRSLPRLRPPRPPATVRFHEAATDDSDGALSAPELPGGVFTAAEYRAWRTPAEQQPRVAYSAESLLDTLRQKEQSRAIYTSDLVPTRPSLPLTLDPREFLGTRGGERRPEGLSGALWVHLLAARGLRPVPPQRFRELYCVLECDGIARARTGIRPGEHSFDWDEAFELDVVGVRELCVRVFSWDPRHRHRLCYRGVLRLVSLLREAPSHSLALRLDPRGTLYLKLRHRDHLAFYARPCSGPELEAVISREASGFAVPLAFKRCLEEIERRGMTVPGIYRLCAAVARKKTLREELEVNPLLADLSPEHVPDINVVTSVLKDWLRELPEPLLHRSAADMLDDVISVCLAEDPAGNAKLVFGIIETLPSVTRNTMLYLLDHLKLVTLHSHRNKMGSQQLALTLGPAVLCCASNTDVHWAVRLFGCLLRLWPAKREDLGGSSSSSGTCQAKPGDLLVLPPSLR